MRLDTIVKGSARSKKDKLALVDIMAGGRSITYIQYHEMCMNFANYVVSDFNIKPEEMN